MNGKTRLLFPVLDNPAASGGRKFAYHVVDFLNNAGIEAWVIHPNIGFRLTWFANQTRVGCIPELFPNILEQKKSAPFKYQLEKLRKKVYPWNKKLQSAALELSINDVLIISETRLISLEKFPRENRKIIFNQNPFFTFSMNYPEKTNPLQKSNSRNILGTIVVSDLNERIQKFVYPDISVKKGRLFIEDEFYYQQNKKTQIAYMPRRGADDARAIINILNFRGLSEDVEFIRIDGLNQSQVAKILQQSLVFLTFANREGFGLPAAEAMACGCIVIGYSGHGGDEFFSPSYCYPINDGDYETFAMTIEEVLCENRANPDNLAVRRELASRTIRDRYSKENSEKLMVSAFEDLLGVVKTEGHADQTPHA